MVGAQGVETVATRRATGKASRGRPSERRCWRRCSGGLKVREEEMERVVLFTVRGSSCLAR